MAIDRRQLLSAWAFAAAALGAAAVFVLTTVLMDQMPDTVLVAIPVVLAALIALASSWQEVRRALAARPSRSVLLSAASGGIAAFWAAPLLVLSQRASDAPYGSVTLFMSTACWGLICAATVLTRREGPASFTGIGAAFASVAASAGLLANWERPSSFSPFAKFPIQESVILLAGVVFVVGALALMSAAKKAGTRVVTLVALGAAAAAALVFALPGLPSSVPAISRASTEIVLLGVAEFAFVWGWLRTTSAVGVVGAGSIWLVTPTLLTALAVVERTTGVYGPNPIIWRAALPAAIVATLAAAVVWFSGLGSRAASGGVRQGGACRWTAWLAGAVTIASLVTLGLPALRAESQGVLGRTFEAAWTMVGFESAAGWMPVAAALVVLAASLDLRRGRRPALAASAALAALAAYPFLLDTTLHTWNTWIPADVQQTYGTEYARFSVTAVASPARTAAVIAAGVSAIAVMFCSVRELRRAGAVPTEDNE